MPRKEVRTLYHENTIEAQVCPMCNLEVCPEEAMHKAHQQQELVWAILKTMPDELLKAEMERRRLVSECTR